MKKLITLFLVVVLITSLGIAASAADYDGNGVIKMGTATIDAKLDPAYTGSLYFTGLGTGTNAYGTPWSYTAEASVYFMYDSTYLYIFAEIIDDDVATKGVVYCMGNNPIQNDCIEFRLNFKGADGDDNHKVAIDAYGYRVFGLEKSLGIIDYDNIEYATELTDAGYCVELAIPCSKGTTDIIAAGKLGFTYQLNDITADGAHQNFTSSFVGEPVKNSPFYALSTEEAIAGQGTAVTPIDTTVKAEDTTPAPADTTAKVEDTTPEADDTTPEADDTIPKTEDTTPKTNDTAPMVDDATEGNNSIIVAIIILVAVLVAACVAAFIVSSKKKKN